MADKTRIEWTEATWNPIRGCSRVSPGCTNCYAERQAGRFSGAGEPYDGLVKDGRWNGAVRLVPDHLRDPIRWKRPRRVFVNSMSDLFHEALAFDDIARVFGVMAACPQHTFQVLTKRAERMVAFFWWLKEKGDEQNPFDKSRVTERMVVLTAQFDLVNTQQRYGPWPLPNVWLGVSVEDQAAAEQRLTLLRQVPAAIRWASFEPLLGPIDLDREYLALACGGGHPFPMLEDRYRTKLVDLLDWAVVGGESGPGARPMRFDWATNLRDQFQAAAVPFYFKQWGEWAPGISVDGNFVHTIDGGPNFQTRAAGKDTMDLGDGYFAVRIGKKAAGRILDGHTHDAYPSASGPDV